MIDATGERRPEPLNDAGVRFRSAGSEKINSFQMKYT